MNEKDLIIKQKPFSTVLKSIMAKFGHNAMDIGKLVGVHYVTIYNILNDQSRPRIDIVLRILRAYNVDYSVLEHVGYDDYEVDHDKIHTSKRNSFINKHTRER